MLGGTLRPLRFARREIRSKNGLIFGYGVRSYTFALRALVVFSFGSIWLIRRRSWTILYPLVSWCHLHAAVFFTTSGSTSFVPITSPFSISVRGRLRV